MDTATALKPKLAAIEHSNLVSRQSLSNIVSHLSRNRSKSYCGCYLLVVAFWDISVLETLLFADDLSNLLANSTYLVIPTINGFFISSHFDVCWFLDR